MANEYDLVSVTSGGRQANFSYMGGNEGISGNGRYVLFSSDDPNLVSGDSALTNDLFMHDRVAGTTVRVAQGGQFTGYDPAVSHDGRFVAWWSGSNGGDSAEYDIYLYDRNTGLNTLISEGVNEAREPTMSADGRYVTFTANVNPAFGEANRQLIQYDTQTKTSTQISNFSDQLNDGQNQLSTSADGRYTAFNANGFYTPETRPEDRNPFDAYVFDAQTGVTENITSKFFPKSSSSSETVISGDGRYVAFVTKSELGGHIPGQEATDVFLYDRTTDQLKRITNNTVDSYGPEFSDDGRYLAFLSDARLVPEDVNFAMDLYRYDTQTGVIERLTQSEYNQEINNEDDVFNPISVSADGSVISFGTRRKFALEDDYLNDIDVYTVTVAPPRGTEGPDLIFGESSDNIIFAKGGNDTVYAGSGSDRVFAGDGNDVAYGGIGNDQVYGGTGNDEIGGGVGNDTVGGGAGNDTIFGGLGDDQVYGGGEDDNLQGNAGNDVIVAGAGNDQTFGGDGADVVYGAEGNDLEFGGAGNDTLFGGSGADTIWGGAGDDDLWGGVGADRYAFAGGSGNDHAFGFNQAEGDRLDLQGQSYSTSFAGDGDVILALSGGGTIRLDGVTSINDSFFV